MIDRGKSHVRDFVDIFESSEDIFSDTFRGDPFFIGGPFALEFVDERLDIVHIDISFVDGLSDTLLDLGTVVHLGLSGGFSNEEIYKFHSLKGCKTSFTFFTLTASTDRLTIFSDTRVDDFGVQIFTLGASHKKEIRSYIYQRIYIPDKM